ncbi:unnamed protein product [Schistocephalus solidus]|uniref:Methyltransf_21 domain-containing protein n=1 Tax=Schistocephalus solidus TaxID=70667 RepID=A0A183SFU6_SCHSO|nr:unnamed protein product [Schistocephalus solidus]
MRAHIDMAVDAGRARVPGLEEFTRLFGVSHYNHFGSIPNEAIADLEGATILPPIQEVAFEPFSTEPFVAVVAMTYAKKELTYLYQLFRLNGYPVSFVKSCLRHQRQSQTFGSNGEAGPHKFYSLPYVHDISEVIPDK